MNDEITKEYSPDVLDMFLIARPPRFNGIIWTGLYGKEAFFALKLMLKIAEKLDSPQMSLLLWMIDDDLDFITCSKVHVDTTGELYISASAAAGLNVDISAILAAVVEDCCDWVNNNFDRHNEEPRLMHKLFLEVTGITHDWQIPPDPLKQTAMQLLIEKGRQLEKTEDADDFVTWRSRLFHLMSNEE